MAITADARNVVMDGSLEQNSGSMTIYGNGDNEVSSTTLKILMDMFDIDKIRLLKIDCEGAEYEILEGATDILNKIQSIRGEIHPMKGKSQEDLVSLIKSEIHDVKMTVLQ